jgi:hypothetical protein
MPPKCVLSCPVGLKKKQFRSKCLRIRYKIYWDALSKVVVCVQSYQGRSWSIRTFEVRDYILLNITFPFSHL